MKFGPIIYDYDKSNGLNANVHARDSASPPIVAQLSNSVPDNMRLIYPLTGRALKATLLISDAAKSADILDAPQTRGYRELGESIRSIGRMINEDRSLRHVTISVETSWVAVDLACFSPAASHTYRLAVGIARMFVARSSSG